MTSRPRRKARSRKEALREEPAARAAAPRRKLVLAAAGALAGIVTLVAWLARVPSHPPMEPAQPESVSPQLAAYLPPFIQDVRDAPESAEAHATLGLVYEANEMWSEARRCFEGAADLDRSEPLASHHVALTALEMKDEAAAELALREAIERDRTFVPAHHRLGRLHLDAGDFKNAERELERAWDLSPHDPLTCGALGELRLRQGDPAGAATLLEEAARVAPRNGTLRHLLGTAYRELGRTDDAERQFKGVRGDGERFMVDSWSQRLPMHAMSLGRQMARATALTNAGRPAEAAAILEETLRWHRDDPAVLDNLAMAWMSAGELEKARMYLARALAANPTHAVTHVDLAALAARRGDLEAALISATRAVELAPSLAEAHRQRASILRQLHRPEEALVDALAARDLDPEAGSSRMHVARALADLGRLADAIDEYRAAVDLDPDLPGARFGLVEALVAAGDRESARVALEAATNAFPQHPLIRELAARHADLTLARK